MIGFLKKTLIAFSIGLFAGSTFAANLKPGAIELTDARPIPSREIVSTGDSAFAQTETYAVQEQRVEGVNAEMEEMGLGEDIDFAWITKSAGKGVVNFVCYSADCAQWAKSKLRVLAVAPARPEEKDFRKAWKDPTIESKMKKKLSEEEQIKQRQMLSYKRLRQE